MTLTLTEGKSVGKSSSNIGVTNNFLTSSLPLQGLTTVICQTGKMQQSTIVFAFLHSFHNIIWKLKRPGFVVAVRLSTFRMGHYLDNLKLFQSQEKDDDGPKRQVGYRVF